MAMCKKCGTMCGGFFLLAGVLFLLQDMGVWSFWDINWYTVAFLLLGLAKIGHGSCKACK